MSDAHGTPLERALVEHLIELLWILDDLPEEQLELETAVHLQDDIGATVLKLPEGERQRFVRIAQQLANATTGWDAERRAQRFREAIVSLGLIERT